MSYRVRTVYHTLQGEGAQAGRAAVFLRFSGCNLWSGRESDRSRAICQFCDTNFVGTDGPNGGVFHSAAELAEVVATISQTSALPIDRRQFARAAAAHWAEPSPAPALLLDHSAPLVVCTGGEPLLQLDDALIDELHERGFEIAVETNGTIEAPSGLDWICVSPKAGTHLRQRRGNELKLVYPQTTVPPDHYEQLEFEHFFLQPMDGPLREENTRAAMAYCLSNPKWRLSLQLHKILGIE
jgi:7-carboxy-7-deazaguanine synthase (Cx14CxxC type)